MIYVLATGNRGKVREYGRLLAGLRAGIVAITTVVPEYEGPEETGDTFEANALLKARAAAAASGTPALADDSGLCVAALDGAPGVRSARFGGPGLDDAGRCRALLAALEEAGALDPADRRASVECAIAVAVPDGASAAIRGRCDGRIIDAPRGDGGFGYDPLFLPERNVFTFAEMAAADKDLISHRAKAAQGLPELLRQVVADPEVVV
jgi:XTP/dITP diphosphohydrolase